MARTFPMHGFQQLRNLSPGVPVGTLPSRVNSMQVCRRVGVARTRLRHLTVRCCVLFIFFARCVRDAAERLICSCCTRTLFRFDAPSPGDIIACLLLSKATSLVIRRNGEAIGLGETAFCAAPPSRTD